MSIVRTLNSERELRDLLDALNDAGADPAVAGEDAVGPFLTAYLDGDGVLPLVVIRPPGEDVMAHDDQAEQLCTQVWRWGDMSLYWPVWVLDFRGEADRA